MFLKRGDALAEQRDFESAYTAYKRAYAYDQTNEMAGLKMERMLEQEDHLAHYGGTQQSGLTPSIEDVIQRAQSEDERDHRLSAAAQPAPPSALPNATAQITQAPQPLHSPPPPQAKTSSVTIQPASRSTQITELPPTPPPVTTQAKHAEKRNN